MTITVLPTYSVCIQARAIFLMKPPTTGMPELFNYSVVNFFF